MTTTTEYVLAFAGTGVGSLLLGKWLSRKKDEIEATIKEQTLYKSFIEDMEKLHKKKEERSEKRIAELTKKVGELKDKLTIFIKQDKEQRENLLKWENYCEKLKVINESQKEIIAKQHDEIEELIKSSK